MSRPALRDVERSHPIVAEAVARGLRITVTVRIGDGWRNFRSRIISGTRASGRIHVEPPVDSDDQAPPDAAKIEPWTVGFRLGHKKFSFTSSVIGEKSGGDGGATTVIAWPESLVQMRRRSFQRASPPKGSIIAVRFWRTNTAPDAREMHYAELENLSAGGLRLNAGGSDELRIGDTFECLFTPRPGAPPIIAEILLRHREAAGKARASLGFQFIGLEQSDEGRSTLERIARLVQDFQRATGKRRM